MPYKMIILDLDHTLLREDQTISPANAAMLQRCQQADLALIIATGRMLHSALPYARKAQITLPIITCQGAMISSLDGDIYHQQVLENCLAQELLQLLQQYPLDVICCHNDHVFAASARKDFPYKDTLPKLGHHHLPLPEHIGDITPLKIGANGDPDIIAQANTAICTTFGQTVHAVQSSPFFLEITHPLATKSSAASLLAQRLDIVASEIIAIGDSMNDLDLLQYAGCGVAVANAVPQVLAAADYITASNEQDGVAQALEHLLFA